MTFTKTTHFIIYWHQSCCMLSLNFINIEYVKKFSLCSSKKTSLRLNPSEIDYFKIIIILNIEHNLFIVYILTRIVSWENQIYYNIYKYLNVIAKKCSI